MISPEEEPLRKENVQPKKRTIKEKIQYVKDNITLEPTLACYVIPGVLSRLATQNLNLDKACRVNKQYGDAVCDALLAREGANYMHEEIAVQELVATLESWKNVLLTAIPSLLLIFLGAWSDRTGKRKICILLPIVGELLVCCSNMINVYFKKLPVEVVMFFEAFLPAITGGWAVTYMGAFSYIADISSEESRTFRVGIATLCLTSGAPIGSALSGILLQEIGYYGVFGLSSLLYLISFGYGFVKIKDIERPKPEKRDVDECSGKSGFCGTFFDINHAKATLKVVLKKGPNQRRTKFILVLASIFFIYGPANGEFIIRYLFTRFRFNWDAVMYSYYNTFFICIHMIGALISITLFSRRLKWDDSILGLISVASKFVGGLATGLAKTTMDMYIAVTIEMFNATTYTALRSISSKLVTTDELGKMVAVFNLMEIVTYLISGPLYLWIYSITIETNAGIVFFVSTALTVLPISFFMWFYLQHRKECRMKSKEPKNDTGSTDVVSSENNVKAESLKSVECVEIV